jgi:hypothetical protein
MRRLSYIFDAFNINLFSVGGDGTSIFCSPHLLPFFTQKKKKNGPRTSLRILSHFGWRTHKRK